MIDDLMGDQLLQFLAVLASDSRLRIVAMLCSRRHHVSELARALQLSRPLVHAHLARMSAVGLISSTIELSPDGKAHRYVELSPFSLCLTPELIEKAVRTLDNSDG